MADQIIGIAEPTTAQVTKNLDADQILNTTGTTVQQERVTVVIKDEIIMQYFDTIARLLYDIRAQLAEFCPETPLLDIDADFDDETRTDSPS